MNPLYPLRDTMSRLRRRPSMRAVTPSTAASGATPFAHVLPSSIRPQTSTIRGTAPHLSIAIVADDRHDCTLRCLSSIVANSPGCEYEILVIEGETEERCAGGIAEVPGIRYLSIATSLGGGDAFNTVCREAQGTFLLQLDPAVELLPGAIDALLAVAERETRIGVVGGKLLTPDGRLLAAGGTLYRDGTVQFEGEGGNPSDSAYRYLREVDFLPRGALLIRRSLWTSLGGFDAHMAPADDIDLAVRARQAGYRAFYEPSAVMVWHEPSARETVLPPSFREKWSEALRSLHAQAPDRSLKARDRVVDGQVVLFIGKHLPEPGGGEACTMVMNLLDAFQRMGHVVKFHAADAAAEGDPRPLERRGIECLLPREAFSFDEWTARHAAEVDIALVLDAELVLSAASLLRQRGGTRVLYFGHALRFARLAAHQQHVGDPTIGTEVLRLFDLERQAWSDADVVLYPSAGDVARVRELVPEAHVQQLLPCTFNAPAERTTVPTERTVLFCCDADADPAGLRWLLQSVLPGVVEQAPAAAWFYSKDPEAVQERLLGVGTREAACVSNLELAVERARVVVLPSLDGAEARRTLLLALAHGIPVVARPDGAIDGKGAETFDERATFEVQQILRLLTDDGIWLTTSRCQGSEAAERLSVDRLTSALTALMGGQDDSLPPMQELAVRAAAQDVSNVHWASSTGRST